MGASMVQVGSGHPIGTIDSQFVNHVWAHDADATRRAALRKSEDEYSGVLTAQWISRRTRRRANTKRAATAQTCLRTSWASNAGNNRKTRKTVSSWIIPSSTDSYSGWVRVRAGNASRYAMSSGIY